MKAIDNKELILSLEELEKERGIKKDYLLEETALVTAYKRNFDSLENVKVVMDRQTGATHVYSIKEVMKKANDDVLEISLKDAQKINKDLKEGDQVEIEIVPKDFGRIAAQTAKQVIIQKLREAERDIIFTEFNDRKGEIVSGLIQKADKNIVVMDLGKLEGVMPAKEQIPTEKYRKLAYEISYYYKKKCSIDGINEADFITHLSSENEKLLNVLGEINRLGLKEEFTQDEIDDYINVINEFNLKKECNNLGEKIHNELSPIEKAKLLQRIIDLKKQD